MIAIRRIRPNGVIETVAGNGEHGFNGDKDDALQATLQSPRSIMADRSGNVYFIDGFSRLVRRLEPSGRLRLVAGRYLDERSFSRITTADRPTELSLSVDSIALDPAGDLYLARISHHLLSTEPHIAVVVGSEKKE